MKDNYFQDANFLLVILSSLAKEKLKMMRAVELDYFIQIEQDFQELI